MIEPHHRRIAGMHVTKNGDIAIVWLSVEPVTGHIHIYDDAIFKAEVLAVIAEGINARGRWIPLSWSHEEIKNSLQERGCKTLPDPASSSDEMAEIVSRDLWERIRTKRISVDKRLKDWLEEAQSLERTDGKIPKDSHPLMSATRIAMQNIKSAKRQQSRRVNRKEERRVAVI